MKEQGGRKELLQEVSMVPEGRGVFRGNCMTVLEVTSILFYSE